MKAVLLIFLFSVPFFDSCQKAEDSTAELEEVAKQKPISNKPQKNNLVQQADNFLRDKKVSDPLKGAVIGAAAGALTGAAVSNNDRAKGAIIGGAVGAGAGALTGVAIDKKQKDGKLFKKGLFKKKGKNNDTPDEN